MRQFSYTRRISAALLLGLLTMLVMAMPASAGRAWCAKDPIVSIDGTPVQIWVAVPEEYQAYVNDRVEVKVKAPKHLKRAILFTDEGFNGQGEKVEWGDLKDENLSDGLVPLGVEVKVKFDQKRMEKDFGKAALEAALGKGMEIPIQITVNVGEITDSYTTQVSYGTHKKTKFEMTITIATAEVD